MERAPTSSEAIKVSGTLPKISAAEAVSLFKNVCIATFPDFSNAEEKMAQYGIDAERDEVPGASRMHHGALVSRTSDVSMSISDKPACSLFYASNDSVNKQISALEAIDAFDSENGLSKGFIRGELAFGILRSGMNSNGRNYYKLKLSTKPFDERGY